MKPNASDNTQRAAYTVFRSRVPMSHLASRLRRPPEIFRSIMSFPMPTESRSDRLVPLTRGKRAARAGIFVNTALAVLKLVAGIVGNSYALVADAIESGADVAASTIVLGGLPGGGPETGERSPFGYG